MNMHLKKTIFLLCTVSAAVSCNYLDFDESEYHSVEYQFSNFDNTKKVATNVYGYLLTGYNEVSNTFIDCASDDAINAWKSTGMKTFYDGSWSATNLVNDLWSHYYNGIAAANYFLENCPEDFPEAIYQENYQINKDQLKLFPYEIRVLRAYFHFELLKRYRNIIIGERQFSMEEVNNLVPSTYEKTVEWIVSECDAAIKELPLTYKDTPRTELARVTKGTAMALKARTLLYAASPLNNPESDKSKWLAAASAAKDIIDLAFYEVLNEETINNPDSKDLIFARWNGTSSTPESNNFPIGYEGGNSGLCPSQSLVESFDMITGEPFDWNNPEHRKKALDPGARDPRLEKTVLMCGQTFKGRVVESWYNGLDGAPLEGASPTSYYLRKHLIEDTNFTTGSSVSYQHFWPLFRYSEVLLNYAEALFEAEGNPDFTGRDEQVDYQLSPRQAADMVRTRYGMPELDFSDASQFRECLRKERRVELAFEGHRFWDIRRWNIGRTTTDIDGLSITRNDDGSLAYEKIHVQDRIWDDKMNWYPISNTELFKNHNLIQNEGWN